MRRVTALLSAGAVLALLAACASSPPTRFYTLSDTAPEAAPPSGAGVISIAGVTIPGEIDRPEIVRRMSPNQLNISELDRWAAPLDEMIRRVLTDDIARRVPNPAAGKQYAVRVDVHEFYGDAGCNVTLRAVWSSKAVAESGTAGSRPASGTQTPSGTQAPGASQPPSGTQAPGASQPPSGTQAPGGSQPRSGTQVPSANQQPTGNEPPRAVAARSEEIQVPSSGACPASLPGTMSIALGQLSDRIIAGVGK
jgi:uncharacterized lipoprotein YmbA